MEIAAMRRTALAATLLIAALPLGALAAGEHTVMQPNELKWGPAPPGLPPGAQVAVVAGDPGKSEPYVIRAKMPAGYKIAAHTHPTDENVTVLSGTFHVGMGDKFDAKKGETVKAGGFFHTEKGMQHYAWASAPTVLQIHGVGPFAINYVNPADDPRNKSATKQ
jgi:quercetin dioxygenase-like cupin family protein